MALRSRTPGTRLPLIVGIGDRVRARSACLKRDVCIADASLALASLVQNEEWRDSQHKLAVPFELFEAQACLRAANLDARPSCLSI